MHIHRHASEYISPKHQATENVSLQSPQHRSALARCCRQFNIPPSLTQLVRQLDLTRIKLLFRKSTACPQFTRLSQLGTLKEEMKWLTQPPKASPNHQNLFCYTGRLEGTTCLLLPLSSHFILPVAFSFQVDFGRLGDIRPLKISPPLASISSQLEVNSFSPVVLGRKTVRLISRRFKFRFFPSGGGMLGFDLQLQATDNNLLSLSHPFLPVSVDRWISPALLVRNCLNHEAAPFHRAPETIKRKSKQDLLLWSIGSRPLTRF